MGVSNFKIQATPNSEEWTSYSGFDWSINFALESQMKFLKTRLYQNNRFIGTTHGLNMTSYGAEIELKDYFSYVIQKTAAIEYGQYRTLDVSIGIDKTKYSSSKQKTLNFTTYRINFNWYLLICYFHLD